MLNTEITGIDHWVVGPIEYRNELTTIVQVALR